MIENCWEGLLLQGKDATMTRYWTWTGHVYSSEEKNNYNCCQSYMATKWRALNRQTIRNNNNNKKKSPLSVFYSYAVSRLFKEKWQVFVPANESLSYFLRVVRDLNRYLLWKSSMTLFTGIGVHYSDLNVYPVDWLLWRLDKKSTWRYVSTVLDCYVLLKNDPPLDCFDDDTN